MNIVVDNEFKALIPPLQEEERAQLEANLMADGCRDPLVVWPMAEYTEDSTGITFKYADHRIDEIQVDGEWRLVKVWDAPDGGSFDLDEWPCILVDGHNRHEICERLEIPYSIVEIEFSNRGEVTEWIIKNQFGRRNISDYQRGVLALKLKPVIEERARANHAANGGDKLGAARQNSDTPVEKIRTDEAVSELANISRDTIRKVEKIEAAAPEEVKVLAGSGEVSINLASQFIDLPEEAKEEALEEISKHEAPAREVIREAVKKAHVANNSGNNEWYTPSKYIELARSVMGSIDTDPATSEIANKTVRADQIYTAEDDGRNKPWAGNVWMNPPYAQPLMSDFAEAITAKYLDGEIEQACILVNNATETQWFQRMLDAASAVCFPRSRIKFVDPDGNPSGAPLQGQAILYMGDNVSEFKAAFSGEGGVLTNG
ncbi:MAG: DNA N-6-adenine-methyltransferase [Acidithiobacillus sp.]